MATYDLHIETEDFHGHRSVKVIYFDSDESLNDTIKQTIDALYQHRLNLRPFQSKEKVLHFRIVPHIDYVPLSCAEDEE
ncbi:MAG: hypothetical protein RR609_06695 [Aurantimicrobium sp.]